MRVVQARSGERTTERVGFEIDCLIKLVSQFFAGGSDETRISETS